MLRSPILYPIACFAALACPLNAQTRTATPVLRLSVYISAACGGKEVTKPAAFTDNPKGLCFERTPFLTERDVETAEFHRGSKGQPEVFLTFHNEAAMRELNVTKANAGKRVGIVLDGKLMSAPEISGASRFLFIDAGLTDAQVIDLVAAFTRQSVILPKR